MKKTILITAIIAILLSAGCLETSTEKYNDDEFLDWFIDTNDEITVYTLTMSDLIEDKDWVELEDVCQEAEDYIDHELFDEIYDFHLSYQYDNIRDMYEDFLDDMTWAFFNYRWAAIDMQDGFYDLADDNFDEGTDLLNDAIETLDDITEYIDDL